MNMADLIKKVKFPRQLVPLSVVASQLPSFLAMLVALFALNLSLLPRVRATIWLTLPLSLLVICFVAGLALAVASANVIFRDVEHITQAVLLPWFFLTPLVYSLDKLPGGLDRHHALKEILRWGNPATPVIEAFRHSLLGGGSLEPAGLLYSAGCMAVVLAAGILLFSRVQRTFLDDL